MREGSDLRSEVKCDVTERIFTKVTLHDKFYKELTN